MLGILYRHRLDHDVEVSQENRYRAQRGISFPTILTTECLTDLDLPQVCNRSHYVTVTIAVTVTEAKRGHLPGKYAILAIYVITGYEKGGLMPYILV